MSATASAAEPTILSTLISQASRESVRGIYRAARLAPMSTPAGYSGTPLPRKLGIDAGHTVLLSGAPAGFDLGELPDRVTVHRRRSSKRYDVVLGFCPDLASLQGGFGPWKALLGPAGALWVAWPKRSSGVPTDLTEDVVREHALAGGLVDVKVCAVDATWSGLKLVYRVTDRSNLSSTQARPRPRSGGGRNRPWDRRARRRPARSGTGSAATSRRVARPQRRHPLGRLPVHDPRVVDGAGDQQVGASAAGGRLS